MSTAALACRNVRGATKSSGFLIRLFPGMLWVPAAVQGRGRMGCVGGVSGDGSKWINEPPCPCNCIWRWLKLLWWPFLARIICLEVGVVTCETLRLLSLQHMCSDLDRAAKWSWITCACTGIVRLSSRTGRFPSRLILRPVDFSSDKNWVPQACFVLFLLYVCL